MKKIVLLFIALVILCVPVEGAKTRNVKNVKQQKQETQKAIKETSKKIDINLKETKRTLNQLNLLTAEIEEQSVIIKNIDKQVAALNNRIYIINDSINNLEKQIERLKKNYIAAVKKIHFRASSYDQLMFVFSADSFQQAYRRMRYLQQFSKWRKKQSDELKSSQTLLQERKAQLQKLKDEKSKSLVEASNSRKKLDSQKAKQNDVVSKLKKEGASLKTVLKEKQKQADALDKELNRLIAEEERKAAERARIEAEKRAAEQRRIAEEKRLAEEKRKKEESAKAQSEQSAKQKTPAKAKEEPKKEQKQPEPKPTPTPKKESGYSMNDAERNLSGSFESNKGNLLFPVTGSYKIVKPFGRQKHKELKYVETDNGGIDIETSAGAKARAVFDGKVSAIFRHDGFNTVVMVRHGNYLSIYVNLTEIYVTSGQDVKAGTPIGKIFSDPDDDNRTILHFEIRKEKVKLNPELWVK